MRVFHCDTGRFHSGRVRGFHCGVRWIHCFAARGFHTGSVREFHCGVRKFHCVCDSSLLIKVAATWGIATLACDNLQLAMLGIHGRCTASTCHMMLAIHRLVPNWMFIQKCLLRSYSTWINKMVSSKMTEWSLENENELFLISAIALSLKFAQYRWTREEDKWKSLLFSLTSVFSWPLSPLCWLVKRLLSTRRNRMNSKLYDVLW